MRYSLAAAGQSVKMSKEAMVQMAAQLQRVAGAGALAILRARDMGTQRGFLRPRWQKVMKQVNLTSFCDVNAWDEEYEPGDGDDDDVDISDSDDDD